MSLKQEDLFVSLGAKMRCVNQYILAAFNQDR